MIHSMLRLCELHESYIHTLQMIEDVDLTKKIQQKMECEIRHDSFSPRF